MRCVPIEVSPLVSRANFSTVSYSVLPVKEQFDVEVFFNWVVQPAPEK